MMLIRIRLKGTDMFVPKSYVTGALVCDKQHARFYDYYEDVPHECFYTKESRAKVWTNLTDLKQVLTRSAEDNLKWNETTWSLLEVVFSDGTAVGLDEFLHENLKVQK